MRDRYEILRNVFVVGSIIGLYAFGLYGCVKTREPIRERKSNLEYKTNTQRIR